jgi:hypothetical protein
VVDVSRDSDWFRRAVGLARDSLGVVSLTELLALGVPRTTVESWVRSGRMIRLHRGVYAIGHDALRREGRWRAALMACGDDAALSHATAVIALELGQSRAWLIDVSVPRGRRARTGIRLHLSRCLPPEDITTIGLLRVTTPTRTLIDVARTHPESYVENVAATAERRGLIDFEQIDLDAPVQLRRILGRGPKLTRAGIERRFLDAVRAACLPEPETNVWVTHGGGEEWQPDFLFRPERVIVEIDDDTHKDTRSFELDRRKDSVRQADGYATPRFTFQRVQHDLPAVVGELTTLLARRNPS